MDKLLTQKDEWLELQQQMAQSIEDHKRYLSEQAEQLIQRDQLLQARAEDSNCVRSWRRR